MFKLIVTLSFVSLIFVSTIATAHYSTRLCSKPGYHCIKARRGDSWTRLWPNYKKRQIVMRINRTNMKLKAGMIIAVPDNLNHIDPLDIAPMPKRIEPLGRKVLIINLSLHAFGAYDQYGFLIRWGPVSGGQSWCSDVNRRCRTPTGQFYVFAKKGPGCVSSKYPIGKGGAPMPFCMFFYGGYAMHGSFLPGYHASHGCVRLFYEDAEWLNKEFINMGRRGTKVLIQSWNKLNIDLFNQSEETLSSLISPLDECRIQTNLAVSKKNMEKTTSE